MSHMEVRYVAHRSASPEVSHCNTYCNPLSTDDDEAQVQPVPCKMRLDMVIGTQNEILIGIMKLLF